MPTYPPLQNDDASILGDAQTILQDPRVQIVTANPAGVPFDRMRPAQNWVIPDATDDVIGLKLAVDPKTHALDFDHPHLVPMSLPLDRAKTPNIQDNPTRDGFVARLLPAPLRDLAPDEHLVTLTSGAFLFPQIYVRKGADPAPPSTGGGTSDGFTEKERAFILNSLVELLNR